MEALFLKLLNMSIAASWLVLAVVAWRVLFPKAPKAVNCVLWGLVAIRLICPFSVESVLSLIPSAETVPQNILYAQKPAIQSGVSMLNNVVNPVLSESLAPNVGDSINPMQVVTLAAAVVWEMGLIGMIVYAGVSYRRIHKKVAASLKLEDNLYICDYIDTPFILGVLKPQIYIPSTLEGDKAAYVIAHEKAHLKRYDHWWKPLGFVLLSVYWFNPVMWVAYILLCRDIELASDEKVISKLNEADKKSYSEALLFCSVPRKMLVACPLAFGEVGVKERVKSVLNYKKPAFWMIAAAVAACVIMAVCFLTNPIEDARDSQEANTAPDYEKSAQEATKEDMVDSVYDTVHDSKQEESETTDIKTDPLETAIHDAILGKDKEKEVAGVLFPCESHVILGMENTNQVFSAEGHLIKENVTVYAMVLRQLYTFSVENGRIIDDKGSHMPVAITFEVNEGGEYTLLEYWIPLDGSYYAPSIREKFPDDIEEEAMDTQKYILAQIQSCYDQAVQFADLDTDVIVESLIEKVLEGSRALSSGTEPYIAKPMLEYRELTYYGKYTLQYCVQESLKGEQIELRELLMEELCQDITGDF